MGDGFDPNEFNTFKQTQGAFDPNEFAQAKGADEPSVAADVAKSVGIGVPKGLIAGLGAAGDARTAASNATDWVANKLGVSPEATDKFKTAVKIGASALPGANLIAQGPTSQDIQHKVEGVTGKFYEPKTTAGRYAGTATEFAANPLSYLGPGGVGLKALTAVTAGLGSEAGGQLTEGTEAEPYARIIGAVLGGGAPRAVGRTVTPLPISQERQALVDTLRHEGVEPTAGQVSGNRALKYAESELGEAPGAGGAGSRAYERTGHQFTRAALARVGETAEQATPEVVDRAATRIGNQFDALSARNHAQMDPQYMNDLFAAQGDYEHLFVDPLRKPMVENIIDHATNQLTRSGTMTGPQYKALRSRIARMQRGNTDPELSMFLGEVRDAMDNLMERNIAANNPHDLGAWRETRNQYRNLLAIQMANTGAGEAAAAGNISPAKLRQAAVKQGRSNYARGRGDFADLARAGETIMSPLPQSGTAPRAFIRGIPTAIGATIGALHGGAGEAAPAALAGAFAPGVAGRALMSGPVQGYLKNQALAGFLRRLSPSVRRSVLAATTGSQGPFQTPNASPFAPPNEP